MKKTFSVLIVDDAFFIRNLIKRAISNKPSKEYSYTFKILSEATNGNEGLDLYKLAKPDIITIDINMPNLNGIELIKELKKIDKNAQIIVISSIVNEKIKSEILNLGVYFIQKPFQEAFLWVKLDKIAEHLMNNKEKLEEGNTIIDIHSYKNSYKHKKNNNKNIDDSDVLNNINSIPKVFINHSETENDAQKKGSEIKNSFTNTRKNYKNKKKNRTNNYNEKTNSFITDKTVNIGDFVTSESIPNLNARKSKETDACKSIENIEDSHTQNIIEEKIELKKVIVDKSINLFDKEDIFTKNTNEDTIIIEDNEDTIIIENNEENVVIEDDEDTIIIKDDEEHIVIENNEENVAIEDDKDTVVIGSDEDTLIIEDNKEDIIIEDDENYITIYEENENDNEENIVVEEKAKEEFIKRHEDINIDNKENLNNNEIIKNELLSTLTYDIDDEIEPPKEEKETIEDKTSENTNNSSLEKKHQNCKATTNEKTSFKLDEDVQPLDTKNDLELSELEKDLAKLQNLQLDLTENIIEDNILDDLTEEFKENNSNLYRDSAENMELNKEVQNYNTVKQENPQIKIAPPKNRELSKIYSSNLEKKYNLSPIKTENNEKEDIDNKKVGGLFSKIFKKK